jgi:hypothetical protein
MTDAPAGSAMSGALAKLSRAELFVAAGALLIVLADVLFGLVAQDYYVGSLPWTIATVTLLAIAALRFLNWGAMPFSHEGILVMAGLAVGLNGVRDLLIDVRSLNNYNTTDYLGMLFYYAGVVLMFLGAWMLWRRRTA